MTAACLKNNRSKGDSYWNRSERNRTDSKRNYNCWKHRRGKRYSQINQLNRRKCRCSAFRFSPKRIRFVGDGSHKTNRFDKKSTRIHKNSIERKRLCAVQGISGRRHCRIYKPSKRIFSKSNHNKTRCKQKTKQ